MSLIVDTVLEYIEQALDEAPDDESRESLRDSIIHALQRDAHHALPEARWDGNVLVCGHEGCGAGVAQLNEDGYSRSWSAEVRGRKLIARYGGSEDFSDDGDGEYRVTCARYLHESTLPDNVDIKWS